MDGTDVQVDGAVFQLLLDPWQHRVNHLQLHVGKALAERLQRIRQQRHVRHAGQAHADVAVRFPAQLVQLLLGTAEFAAHRFGPAQKNLTHRGDGHPFGPALEKHHAQFLLQLLDAAGHRRLRHPQLPRGGTHAAAFSDRQEVPQRIDFHGVQSPGQLSIRYQIGIRLVNLASFEATLVCVNFVPCKGRAADFAGDSLVFKRVRDPPLPMPDNNHNRIHMTRFKAYFITAAVLPGAVLAHSAIPAASSLQIYGRMDASFNAVNIRGAGSSKTVSSDTSFIGFRGTEDLGDGVSAFFKLESQIASDTGVSGGLHHGRPVAQRHRRALRDVARAAGRRGGQRLTGAQFGIRHLF